ncbi:MAG: hypothetical protein HYU76_02390 [Betaproteobacteria bacterium]|nr:hypothetical protein [Betaproteobacteria bacterium]
MMRLLALACLLAAITAPAPAAEPLGRLFFTPAQRGSLDVARTQRARTTVATEKTNEEAVPVPEVITYGGMVRRNDGKTTVWINNRAVHDKEAVGGASMVSKVRPDGGVSLQVPQSNRSVDLKVGQSVELLSGSIEESYARRTSPKPESKPAPQAAKSAAPPKPGLAAEKRLPRAGNEREQPETAAQTGAAEAPRPAADVPRKGN